MIPKKTELLAKSLASRTREVCTKSVPTTHLPMLAGDPLALPCLPVAGVCDSSLPFLQGMRVLIVGGIFTKLCGFSAHLHASRKKSSKQRYSLCSASIMQQRIMPHLRRKPWNTTEPAQAYRLQFGRRNGPSCQNVFYVYKL